MIRASICIVSITALAAVLAIIATGVTAQWQRAHRTTQLVRAANLPATIAVPRLCHELLLARIGAVNGQAAWIRCAMS